MLKAWGHRLWKRIGFKKAKIAVARKLAVDLLPALGPSRLRVFLLIIALKGS